MSYTICGVCSQSHNNRITYKYYSLQALGGEYYDGITKDSTVATLVYCPDFHYFGFVCGAYTQYLAPSLFDLYNNHDLFDFWQLDTQKLINKEWHFKYQATGLSFNQFVKLSPNLIPNFKPRNHTNVQEMNNDKMIRKIAHCLNKSMKKLKTENESLKHAIQEKDKALAQMHKKFKVIMPDNPYTHDIHTIYTYTYTHTHTHIHTHIHIHTYTYTHTYIHT